MRPSANKLAQAEQSSAVPLVSVISPFHNRRHCLPALIETLRHQTFTDFELIIVDDGSTDGLADAVAQIETEFSIRFIRFKRNRGAAAARNAGIDDARGRYVALLDSDDSWHPEKLRLQVRQLELNRHATRLVSLTRQLVKSLDIYVSPSRVMSADDDVGSYLFLRGGVIQSSMMMLSRELAARVRFDEASLGHDDWSFALRLQANGARFEMLQQPLTVYDDTAGRARRSPAYSAARLTWLEARRMELGEKAYWAASAAVASHLQHARGINPPGIILSAYRRNALGIGLAGYYTLAWLFPDLRMWARRLHQMWRGRTSGWVS